MTFRNIKIFFPVFILIYLSACNTVIHYNRSQKVRIVSEELDAKVYVNNQRVRTDKKVELKKNGFRTVVAVHPGHKNQFQVIRPVRGPLYFPISLLNLYGLAGFFIDYANVPHKYPKRNFVTVGEEIPKRGETQKDIRFYGIEPIKVKEFRSNNKTFIYFIPKYGSNYDAKLAEFMSNFDGENAPKNLESNQEPYYFPKLASELKDPEWEQQLNEVEELFEKFLENTGYTIDEKKVLKHPDEEARIEASIVSSTLIYQAFKYAHNATAVQLEINWRFYNVYGETTDSITVFGRSGFIAKGTLPLFFLMNDAMEDGFIKLTKTTDFKRIVERKPSNANNLQPLAIAQPTNPVQKLDESLEATVTILKGDGHGSGFFINNEGYLITNYHVVCTPYGQETQDSIMVKVSDSLKLKARVVQVSQSQDLAVLKVDYVPSKAFKLATEEAPLFEPVYAIGTPKLEQLERSINGGIISAYRKSAFGELIQLSIAINPGNSGGPIVNQQAKLRGVVVSKMVGRNVEGIGMAIPGNKIMEYLNLNYHEK